MRPAESAPGRKGYVISAIVFAAGILAAVALVGFFAYGLFTLDGGLERVVVPGSEQVELSDTGRYTIYYERRSRVDGVDYETDRAIPDIDITVTRIEDGEVIQVNPSLVSTSYELTHHAGQSIRTFDIDEPGTYEISSRYAVGTEGPDFVLAVGQGVARSILTSIGSFLAAGAVFCTLTFVAIVIAGITLYRRHRFEQDQRDSRASRQL